MASLTQVHVVISLVGIATGFVVLYGLLSSRRMERWTAVFLATTLATTLTGFAFGFNGLTPAFVVGIISVAVLAPAIVARYAYHMRGGWRRVYVIGAVAALYFNTFVLVAQGFLKVPALNALAPTGSEPAFAIAQGIVLAAFVAAGILAVKRFRPGLRIVVPTGAAIP